jgi:hypothetical protein
MKRSKILVWLTPLMFIISSQQPASAEWFLESQNSRSGVATYASTFWIENFGPANLEDIEQEDLEEGTFWSILTASCVGKKLSFVITLEIAGSGNVDIRLDNPGYAYLKFNLLTKKFRTSPSNFNASLSFVSDANKILSETLKTSRLSITLRELSTRERVTAIFDLSGLSKAKARFRSAGCSFPSR